MVVLDERYSYILSQCRESCRRLTLSGSGKGYSGCEMFVLRAPDPELDARPAYQARQVCMLIGRRTDGKPMTRQNGWPRPITSPNDLFGYPVERSSDYPPLIIGRKV
jgi:hypothetical protein